MFDPKRYPAEWKQISHRIRFERAGGKCEQCSAPHGYWIVRSQGTDDYLIIPDDGIRFLRRDGSEVEIGHEPDGFNYDRPVKVILTVHHIGVAKPDGSAGSPDDKMDCRDDNLIALCQRCHLEADRPDNIKRAVKTRLKNKHAAIQDSGQKPLFEEA